MVSTRPSRVKGHLKRNASKPAKELLATPKASTKKEAKAKVKTSAKKTSQVSNTSEKAASSSKPVSVSKASASKDKGPKRVRVWWPPTKNKKKTQYSGAYWPATVLKKYDTEYEVRYDNGDTERVDKENVGPYSPPVDFGDEEFPLVVGEFVEVFNNSKTDPAAWVGRMVKKQGKKYLVEYPFHDAEPELVRLNLIRRARVWDRATKQWHVVKPFQTWKDGEVTSPTELKVIMESQLEKLLEAGDKEPKSAAKESKPAAKDTKSESKKRKGASEEPAAASSKDEKPPKAKKTKAVEEKAAEPAPKATKKRKTDKADKEKPATEPAVPTADGAAASLAAAPGMQPIMLPPSMLANLPPGAQLVPVMMPPNSQAPNAPPTMMMVLQSSMQGYPATAPLPLASPKPLDPTQPQPSLPNLPSAVAPVPESDGAPSDSEKPKKVKKKDPNAPKRPITGYLVFLSRNRQKILDEFTAANGQEATDALSLSDVQRLLGAKWKEVSEEEKKACEEEAERDRQRYKTELDSYIPPAEDELVEEDTKEGGKRAKKDPNAPRKPSTAYIFFCKEFRKNHVDHNKITFAEATNLAADAWRKADAETKARFEQMAAADKDRHTSELETYKAAAAAAAAAAPPKPPPAAAPAAPKAATSAPPLPSAIATTSAAAAQLAPRVGHLRPVLPSIIPPGAPGFPMFRFPPPQPGARPPPFPMFPFPPPAPAPAAQDPETAEALATGLDMKKARVALQRHYTVEAYYLLLDAWRQDSPKLQDAVRSWRQNIKGQQRPDWKAFMIGVFGMEKMSTMQKNAVTAASAQGAAGGPTPEASGDNAAAEAEGEAAEETAKAEEANAETGAEEN